MENKNVQEIVPVEGNKAFELVGGDKEIKLENDDVLIEETTALTAVVAGEKLATAVRADEENKSIDFNEERIALTTVVTKDEKVTTVSPDEEIKLADESTALTAVVACEKQAKTVNIDQEIKSADSDEETLTLTAVIANAEQSTTVRADEEIKLAKFNEEGMTVVDGENKVTPVNTGEEIKSTDFNEKVPALTIITTSEQNVMTVSASEEIKSSDFNEEDKEGAMALTLVTYEHQYKETMALTVVADDEQMQEGTMMLTLASAAGEETVGDGAGEVTMASCGESSAKRKRGRPKKETLEYSASAPPQKRTRGRPQGTGKNQRMAALGDALGGDTGGSHFTPCIITVHQGEDIAEKIRSFCAATPDSVCILSASGTVSVADLKTPGPHAGVLRHQGELSIVTLMGSYTYPKKVGGKLGLLTAQLAYPDGRLCGGAVGGQLVAATPTQVALATFKQNMRKVQKGRKRPHHMTNDVTVAAVVEAVSPMQRSGMRLLAVAERVDEGTSDGMNQPVTYAQPIGWTPFASPI